MTFVSPLSPKSVNPSTPSTSATTPHRNRDFSPVIKGPEVRRKSFGASVYHSSEGDEKTHSIATSALIIPQNEYLQKINSGDSLISVLATAESIVRFLKENGDQVTCLNLSELDDELTSPELDALLAEISKIATLTNLKSLIFEHFYYCPGIDVFFSLLENNPNLSEVCINSLQDFHFPDFNKILIEECKKLTKLKSLEIGQLSKQDILYLWLIIPHLTMLEGLIIYSSDNIRHSPIQWFPLIPNLGEIPDSEIPKKEENFSQLQNFSLINSEIDSKAAIALGMAMNKLKIHTISLIGCHMGDQEIEDFLAAIQGHPTIEHLILSRNSFGQDQTTSSAVASMIANKILTFPRLKTINCSQNGFDEEQNGIIVAKCKEHPLQSLYIFKENDD